MSEKWESKSLSEVCIFISRGISPKYIDEGGILVINQKCIREHRVNLSLGRRHNNEVKKVKIERLVELGDVLVNSTGTGTLGRVAQVRDALPEPVTVDSHVTIVRPNPDIFQYDYFGYLMIGIEDKLKAAGEGASGQTELSRKAIENDFIVNFPKSKIEQEKIAKKLDIAFSEIVKSESLLKQKKNLLDELRNTLLYESLNYHE